MAVPGPPPIDAAAIRSYCKQRVPPHALDQVRVEAIVDGNTVTIAERRPWRTDLGPEWTTGPPIEEIERGGGGKAGEPETGW